MKLNHLENLEKRSLFAAITCEVAIDVFAAECNLAKPLISDSITDSWSIVGGTVTLSSDHNGLRYFSYSLTEAQLILTNNDGAPVVIGSCSNIKGHSGFAESNVREPLCDYGPRSGISGAKSTIAGGFYEPVSFTLTTKPFATGALTTLKAGRILLSGPATISLSTDTQAAGGTLSFEWYPVVSDSSLPNPSTVEFAEPVRSIYRGSFMINNPNVNLDHISDVGVGGQRSPRQQTLDKVWAQFPM